jgi:hypothetical protein
MVGYFRMEVMDSQPTTSVVAMATNDGDGVDSNESRFEFTKPVFLFKSVSFDCCVWFDGNLFEFENKLFQAGSWNTNGQSRNLVCKKSGNAREYVGASSRYNAVIIVQVNQKQEYFGNGIQKAFIPPFTCSFSLPL